MQTPVDIAFRHCEPSEEIRSEIAAQVQRLEKFSPRITSCRVVVTGPQTGHRRGGFEVELRIAMPEHNKVVVDKSRADAPEREHALVAIREAFDAALRQIENVMREFRGQVKHHAEASHGRVKNLLAREDYGFIETADGRIIYFHRNAVLDAAFDRLKVGSEVAFAEEEGVKGPQASTVRVVGGHRRAYPIDAANDFSGEEASRSRFAEVFCHTRQAARRPRLSESKSRNGGFATRFARTDGRFWVAL